jgi:phytoene dehydrogenase-like protein
VKAPRAPLGGILAPLTDFDDLLIGSGMAGLAVASLLANDGRRVGVLEAHDSPGGYAHSFRVKDYQFCAQVHYIFNCGEGESIHDLLSRLGVADQVPFVRLDPEGFDHIVVAGDRFRIPNGLGKLQNRLSRRYPGAERPLRRYFEVISALGAELDGLDVPTRLSPLRAARRVPRPPRALLSPLDAPGSLRPRRHAAEAPRDPRGPVRGLPPSAARRVPPAPRRPRDPL